MAGKYRCTTCEVRTIDDDEDCGRPATEAESIDAWGVPAKGDRVFYTHDHRLADEPYAFDSRTVEACIEIMFDASEAGEHPDKTAGKMRDLLSDVPIGGEVMAVDFRVGRCGRCGADHCKVAATRIRCGCGEVVVLRKRRKAADNMCSTEKK